jgi:DNA-binding GntR family transcriptional regulator
MIYITGGVQLLSYLDRIEDCKTRNPFKTTNEIVYMVLKKAIDLNEFYPGQRIYENELSEMFGVSRTPIREAFKHLEGEGYVETRKRKGTYISGLRMNKLSEIFYARMGIEIVATKLAIVRMTPRQFSQLEKMNEKIKSMIIDQGKELIMQYDNDFHKIIFNTCGNQYLSEMNDFLRNELIREETYRTKMYNFNTAGLDSFKKSHCEVFKAFLEKDPIKVENAVKEHSRATFNYYGLDCEI